MRNVAVFFAISIAVLLWLSRGDAAPQADPPALRPISSIAEELNKDGTFSEEDAKTIALEVARRIWFPEPRRLTIASELEESGRVDCPLLGSRQKSGCRMLRHCV